MTDRKLGRLCVLRQGTDALDGSFFVPYPELNPAKYNRACFQAIWASL